MRHPVSTLLTRAERQRRWETIVRNVFDFALIVAMIAAPFLLTPSQPRGVAADKTTVSSTAPLPSGR